MKNKKNNNSHLLDMFLKFWVGDQSATRPKNLSDDITTVSRLSAFNFIFNNYFNNGQIPVFRWRLFNFFVIYLTCTSCLISYTINVSTGERLAF